ncbi:MAG: hypothetical protein MI924_01775 [Chloroflexales bacterium]|nr:hypothetical protein [Chloroflexales bacterium]
MVPSSSATATRRDLDLPILRLRVTLRLLADTVLPAAKGALLRGGFGYVFQQAACARPCWGAAHTCSGGGCPYRQILEPVHPPDVPQLHDLPDVPRPFVIQPPQDQRTRYPAGVMLECGLALLGRGIAYLPYFLFGFEHLGRLGLGRQRAPARLERVEALRPWQPVGRVIYQDGQVTAREQDLPILRFAEVAARGDLLPSDLRLTLHTPLRLKARGGLLRMLDPAALVQATC